MKTGAGSGAASTTLGEPLHPSGVGEEAEGAVLSPCRQIAAVLVAGAQPELPNCSLQAGLGCSGHAPCPIPAGGGVHWRALLHCCCCTAALLHPDLNPVLSVRLTKKGSDMLKWDFAPLLHQNKEEQK